MTGARKVLCTLAVGRHAELLEIARPTFVDFADRHGYDFFALDRTLAPHRAASWSKIPLLHDLVQRYDLAVWVDSDAVIVDPTVDIAAVMEPRRFVHLVEHNLPDGRVPNCGVMALRGGRRARRFLERVWRAAQYAQHEWWENAAVLDALGYRLRKPVRPARPSVWRLGLGGLAVEWNSIPDDPAVRPRIAHFPGLPFEERLRRMDAAVATMLPAALPLLASGGGAWTNRPRQP